MFNKCIACLTCNHFYHGKCINLNKQDITKIEKLCGSYMCSICISENLPINACNESVLKQIKTNTSNQVSKQCFTCSNNIIKWKRYPNKCILYNNKKENLCEDCSKLRLSVPVRDKSLLEFQDCAICKKLVKYEAIFCNACQHLVHPYCNGINKFELDELSKVSDDWYCLNCNLDIYPNYL